MLSHFGAVRADRNVPNTVRAIYDCSGQAWFDPQNATYAFVLEKMLGRDNMEEMNISNVETLGDMLEAFFGLCYFMQHPENQCARLCCRSQLESWDHLDAVVWYVYHHWDKRDMLFKSF